jgi:hypothetical protein
MKETRETIVDVQTWPQRKTPMLINYQHFLNPFEVCVLNVPVCWSAVVSHRCSLSGVRYTMPRIPSVQ